MESRPANPQLLRFRVNTHGRDFAVGDIHGCFTALKRALDYISFNPAKDRLFSVGDLVDRGPESDHVLEWLNRPWFHAICGNHDFMAWRSALGNPYQAVDHQKHGGAWLNELNRETLQQVGMKLAKLPLAIEVETREGLVGLVHADCPYDDWKEMQSQRLSEHSVHCCLWSQERYVRSYATPVRNVRAVIHGHTTLATPKKLGNVIYIDTGGWIPARGHFTFIDLQKLQALKGSEPAIAGIPRHCR